MCMRGRIMFVIKSSWYKHAINHFPSIFLHIIENFGRNVKRK